MALFLLFVFVPSSLVLGVLVRSDFVFCSLLSPIVEEEEEEEEDVAEAKTMLFRRRRFCLFTNIFFVVDAYSFESER
tara:strand:- start:1826 stop:2056 length:231 start_codon:yes stop_codon:yes gene_type:complete